MLPRSPSESPPRRFLQGAAVLSVIFVVAVVGYRLLGDYSWTEALWIVVITISTVGYGEHSTLSPRVQIWTVVVILLGVSAAVYTVGGFIQWMLAGELNRLLGNRRMSQELEHMSRHVIICGFGRMGSTLAADLRHQGRSVVIIDTDATVNEELRSMGFVSVHGDATDDDALRRAGIERALTLITVLPSDADNVFITLTARNLNTQMQIVARAEQSSTESKLRQAGANRVVMPTVLSAQRISRMVTRPATAELIDLVTEADLEDVELDEILLAAGTPFLGTAIADLDIHRNFNLLPVAIKSSDGQLKFNPNASYCLCEEDIILVLGHHRDIAAFRKSLN